MERVRRRFWTGAVTLLASAIILAAVVSGLFQLAVLALPSYRAELSAWVTRVADRPVEIGGIHLAWRGLYPRIDLTEITLYDDDGSPALTADRLGLGFSGWRLLLAEYTPTRIELSGLNLAADVDEEGNLRVAGFDTLGDEPFPRKDELLRQLARFKSVQLENCRVQLTHARLGRTPLPFTLVSAEIDRTRAGFDLEAELQLPHVYGDRLQLAASIEGQVAKPGSWNGEFDLRVQEAALQPWLEQWLQPQTLVQANGVEVEARGDLRAGRLQQLRAELAAKAVVAARAGRAHGLKNLKLDLDLRQSAGAWELDIRRLNQDGKPLLSGALRLLPRARTDYDLDADLDLVDLGPLTAWLSNLRAQPAAVMQLASLQGELRNVVLRLRKRPTGWQYALRSELKGLSFHPANAAGFDGLDGTLSADQDSGRLQLTGAPLTLQLPQQFSTPLHFDALSGELTWRRAVQGWALHAPSFAWRGAETQGSGQLRLELPSARGGSPRIDLNARFSAGNLQALKPLMPRMWSANLREWLDQAVRAGRVPEAQLRLRGALADFPFARPGSGEWQLVFDVVHGELAFAPDWPAIDQLSARLRFSGPTLEVTSRSARFGGNPIQEVRARFADVREGLLHIDGRIDGEVARFYELLRRTPLQKPLAGLLQRTRAAGPAAVSVQLDIPLRDMRDTRVAGEVALGGVQLFYENLDQPVDDIRGRVRFGSSNVEAEALTALFGGLKLAAHIEPRAKTAGVIVADFSYSPQLVGGVNAFVPELVRTRLLGESRWRAELPIDAPDAALTLSSDLRGTAVQFPAPLGKSAAESAPVRIALGSDASAPLRVRLDYLQRLGADIALARDGQRMKPQAVHLHLGGGFPPPAQAPGVVITGSAAALDLMQWMGAVAGGAAEGLGLREVDIKAERWLLDEYILGPAALRWRPDAEGWRARLEGDSAQGELRYLAGSGGALRVNLKQLRVQRKPASPPPAPSGLSTKPARDPNSLPTLELRCERLVADDIELGQVTAKSVRIADGQRLETVFVNEGPLVLTASGQWRRSANHSSADLRFDARTDDVATVLRALGYTPNLSGQRGQFSGRLSWPAAPRLDWQLASGRIDVEVNQGTVKAVEPGAGRVLGLFNLYAIPRRLALDFRDVVASGLSFDTLQGSFELGHGVATTQDMFIQSPSLRMEIRGQIGLAARTFNQTVRVYPDVSSGVTLGAALLGGPAVGALVLLAQEVLDKPLEQATQLSYRVTGSWDNPKIERGGTP